MAIARKTARLDLIQLAATVIASQDSSREDARILGELVGSLCRDRQRPVPEFLNSVPANVLRAYVPAEFQALADQYEWEIGV